MYVYSAAQCDACDQRTPSMFGKAANFIIAFHLLYCPADNLTLVFITSGQHWSQC